ncbi:MAG: GNAT family N-acetyltransferase [Paracoccaceae bacterium]|nr:GNAT family N-acetyltransferase [Paracoccaceae bacterium]
MEVRTFETRDAEALGMVFHRAVREGARARYGDTQTLAWSPAPPSGKAWAARLGAADTVVAEKDGEALGFMTVDEGGYLDLAFVVPEVMGQGVADTLYAVLESRARARRVARLTTQASLLAEPFFARHGWSVTRRQEVEMRGVVLQNAWMEKPLRVGH